MANEALYDEELDTSDDDDYQESPPGYDAYSDAEQPAADEAQWLQPESPPESTFEEGLAAADAQPLQGLDQLPMALTLRCGSLNLTLGDLRRIAAGTVLEVSGVTPGFATLCHGDRVVAEGELVDVDGRLGLQITRMASPA
ncbi:FliM/FliN family flagellar motor switch protein [Pseudomonas sp. LP_7_YM]|uniref:FliM/FliN family flagellar motor switch protein n=1 Tax=Pseudomonas sp. LP_7_YM TaxID=2485137 RepID=UPI00105C65EC|nr:FliM/FliN family flagellar motor switch protein [Pseudomonas sp. LP_7_YM]TDV72767.1 type III secretion protein Q [Pseudomonas sp. LP_7_YM]